MAAGRQRANKAAARMTGRADLAAAAVIVPRLYTLALHVALVLGIM